MSWSILKLFGSNQWREVSLSVKCHSSFSNVMAMIIIYIGAVFFVDNLTFCNMWIRRSYSCWRYINVQFFSPRSRVRGITPGPKFSTARTVGQLETNVLTCGRINTSNSLQQIECWATYICSKAHFILLYMFGLSLLRTPWILLHVPYK